MKKLLLLIIISILIFTGCSGEVTENDNEQSQDEVTIWNGPTEGPWEDWNRTNNGDQYFKYDLIYGEEESNGWVTIDIKNIGDNQYEFDVELTLHNYFSESTSPDGNTTFNDSANFTLNNKDGFFEATYQNGDMSGAIYEIIGRLDEQSSLIVNFNENDIVWETGGSATHEGNGVTVNTIGEESILGISGYEVEMEFHILEEGPTTYIINPDIRYPLYIYEEHARGNNFYEFTLVEYNYTLKD